MGIIILVLLVAGAGAFVVLTGFTLPSGAAANSTEPEAGSSQPVTCPGNLTQCGGACVDLRTDNDNCGKCGFAVPYGMVCRDGEFASLSATATTSPPPSPAASPTTAPTKGPCPSGQNLCSGKCTDLLADNDNCGKCGWDCPKGQICQSGQCLPPDLTPVSTGTAGVTVTQEVLCSNGEIACGASCVDVFTDKTNCGVCGRACGSQEICVRGRCGPACASGKSQCDDTCVDLDTDMENCGACGTVCRTFPPNSLGALCAYGECIVSGCQTNYGDCNEKIADGCESDLRFDDNNCGACGDKCPTGTKCSLGQCT